MAIAWIAWRDAALVQRHCADYRKHCTHWVGRSSTIPTAEGKSTESFDGWELNSRKPKDAIDLSRKKAFLCVPSVRLANSGTEAV